MGRASEAKRAGLKFRNKRERKHLDWGLALLPRLSVSQAHLAGDDDFAKTIFREKETIGAEVFQHIFNLSIAIDI